MFSAVGRLVLRQHIETLASPLSTDRVRQKTPREDAGEGEHGGRVAAVPERFQNGLIERLLGTRLADPCRHPCRLLGEAPVAFRFESCTHADRSQPHQRLVARFTPEQRLREPAFELAGACVDPRRERHDNQPEQNHSGDDRGAACRPRHRPRRRRAG